MTELPSEAFDDVAQVLRCAFDGDTEAVAATFDAVLHRAGVLGAYDVAWCLAATMLGGDVPKGPVTLEFPGIDEAEYDTRWVARFVSAYANSDPPTSAALFGAAVADGQLPVCLRTLAGSAVATMRLRSE